MFVIKWGKRKGHVYYGGVDVTQDEVNPNRANVPTKLRGG